MGDRTSLTILMIQLEPMMIGLQIEKPSLSRLHSRAWCCSWHLRGNNKERDYKTRRKLSKAVEPILAKAGPVKVGSDKQTKVSPKLLIQGRSISGLESLHHDLSELEGNKLPRHKTYQSRWYKTWFSSYQPKERNQSSSPLSSKNRRSITIFYKVDECDLPTMIQIARASNVWYNKGWSCYL